MKGNKRGLGYRHSEETIRKMSLKKLGHKVSEETKEKCRRAHLGKKLKPETIEKMRQAKLKKGESNRRAISFAFRGPDGNLYTGKNIMNFVRSHAHLFSLEDLRPFKENKAFDCLATRRLYALRNGNRQENWNGWSAVPGFIETQGSENV